MCKRIHLIWNLLGESLSYLRELIQRWACCLCVHKRGENRYGSAWHQGLHQHSNTARFYNTAKEGSISIWVVQHFHIIINRDIYNANPFAMYKIPVIKWIRTEHAVNFLLCKCTAGYFIFTITGLINWD